MVAGHNLAFIRFGYDLENIRKGSPFYDQGMVSSDSNLIGDSCEDPFSVMLYYGGFSMHQPICPDYVATEVLSDRLMTQTDP